MEIFLPSEVKKLPLQSNNFQSHRDSIPDANGDSLPFRRNKSCPKRPDKPETELPWPDPTDFNISTVPQCNIASLTPQDSRIGDTLIEIDPRYFRPTEVEYLLGDYSKARQRLSWEPRVKFKELVEMMVDADIRNLEEMKQCQDVIRKLSNSKTLEG
jgi:hypothetical protein